MDEDVSRAMVASGDLLCRLRPDGWVDHREGFLVRKSGLPVPSLNGVLCWEPNVDPDEIASALDAVAREDVPYALLFRAGTQGLEAAARAAGLRRGDDARLMRLDQEPEATEPTGLTVRLLDPSEMASHVQVAADGFEAPLAVFEKLGSTVAGHDAVVTVLGELQGEPVTTAQGLVQGESVGVFSVATPPTYRGRGYGAWVTAAVVAEGRRRGARWAWLQASEQGYGVYERLGFRSVGSYEVWTSAW